LVLGGCVGGCVWREWVRRGCFCRGWRCESSARCDRWLPRGEECRRLACDGKAVCIRAWAVPATVMFCSRRPLDHSIVVVV